MTSALFNKHVRSYSLFSLEEPYCLQDASAPSAVGPSAPARPFAPSDRRVPLYNGLRFHLSCFQFIFPCVSIPYFSLYNKDKHLCLYPRLCCKPAPPPANSFSRKAPKPKYETCPFRRYFIPACAVTGLNAACYRIHYPYSIENPCSRTTMNFVCRTRRAPAPGTPRPAIGISSTRTLRSSGLFCKEHGDPVAAAPFHTLTGLRPRPIIDCSAQT